MYVYKTVISMILRPLPFGCSDLSPFWYSYQSWYCSSLEFRLLLLRSWTFPLRLPLLLLWPCVLFSVLQDCNGQRVAQSHLVIPGSRAHVVVWADGWSKGAIFSAVRHTFTSQHERVKENKQFKRYKRRRNTTIQPYQYYCHHRTIFQITRS